MLLLKLLLVPSLIAMITLAGRRWGPAVAGWLSGFPVVAGPVLLIIGLEQGPQFAGHTAHAALAAALGTVSFLLAYAWAALRLPWPLCVLAAGSAFAAATTLLMLHPLALWPAFALTTGGLLLAPLAFPRTRFVPTAGAPSRLELPARMLAGAVLTYGVTASAAWLGPRFSGLLSVFPVIGLVFAVFSHLAWGPGGAILLLHRMVRGLHAFTSFCCAVAVAMPVLGTAGGFFAALLVALLVQAATFRRQ